MHFKIRYGFHISNDIIILTSFRHSVNWGTKQKKNKVKREEEVPQEKKTPIRQLNKRSFQCTKIWYTLWLMHFNTFCQNLRVSDADEK